MYKFLLMKEICWKKFRWKNILIMKKILTRKLWEKFIWKKVLMTKIKDKSFSGLSGGLKSTGFHVVKYEKIFLLRKYREFF